MHTTNYFNTFIEVAEDCPAGRGEIPPVKAEKRTIANIQFDLLNGRQYQFTSDAVLFQAFAEKNDLTEKELKEASKLFFSKGQPCFRASPLTKRYGWGIHSNEEGKIAMYGSETMEYEKLRNDPALKVIKAMRSSKKTGRS